MDGWLPVVVACRVSGKRPEKAAPAWGGEIPDNHADERREWT